MRPPSGAGSQLEGDEPAGGYTVKFAIDFLDAVPDPPRAAAALERLRPALDADGCLAVPGGTENEKLTPLDFSPRPGLPSRALFTDDQIEADLDRLEAGQREDGGWTVEYPPVVAGSGARVARHRHRPGPRRPPCERAGRVVTAS